MQEAWRRWHNLVSLLKLYSSLAIKIILFFLNTLGLLRVNDVLGSSDGATWLHTVLPHNISFGRCWPHLFRFELNVLVSTCWSTRVWPFSITKTFHFNKRLSLVVINRLLLFSVTLFEPFWFINGPKFLFWIYKASIHSIAFLYSLFHSLLLTFWYAYTTTCLQMMLLITSASFGRSFVALWHILFSIDFCGHLCSALEIPWLLCVLGYRCGTCNIVVVILNVAFITSLILIEPLINSPFCFSRQYLLFSGCLWLFILNFEIYGWSTSGNRILTFFHKCPHFKINK